MSILRQSRRGDMYVEVGVEIPVNLTSKQKTILGQNLKKKEVHLNPIAPNPKVFFGK